MKFVVFALLVGFVYTLSPRYPNPYLIEQAKLLLGCKDKYPRCSSLSQYCSQIKDYCPDTCGKCRAVFPPSCYASLHGCCWDKVTISGPNGEGCPECKDQDAVKCKKLSIKGHCKENHIRRACPLSCGVKGCNDNCHDHEDYKSYCEGYKRANLCGMEKIQQYCGKTCNFCGQVVETKLGSSVTRQAEKKSVQDAMLGAERKLEQKSLLDLLEQESDTDVIARLEKENEAKKREIEENDALLKLLHEDVAGKANKREAAKKSDDDKLLDILLNLEKQTTK